MSALPAPVTDPFAEAHEHFDAMVRYLGIEGMKLTESELERELKKQGAELLRKLLQAHLDVRGPGKAAGPVQGSDGIEREKERVHERKLETIFGEVTVARTGYGAEGSESLHPLDADLNLPQELYSHEVRRRAALQVAEDSFDGVVEVLSEYTSAEVGKRQVEELAVRAAQDFDAFYQGKGAWTSREGMSEILVLSVDQKGVVMRKSALREYTRKRAERSKPKLATRLSPGEKRNKKRMATVAAVYTIAPYIRPAEEVVRGLSPYNEREPAGRPRPEFKRVWASVEKGTEEVIEEAIGEARTRDPDGKKQWVVLVDGDPKLLKMVRKLFRHEAVQPTIIVDLIHVVEYLWKAGLAFFGEGNPELDPWVAEHLLAVMNRHPGHVAAGLRRSATLRKLNSEDRQPVDKCADYLLKRVRFIRYNQYLAAGLPIATGVIEGACRYLVKDRMDITGARWGLKTAEAVLRLRAIKKSHDFEAYWQFHERQEYLRNYASRYADGKVALLRGSEPRNLKRVK